MDGSHANLIMTQYHIDHTHTIVSRDVPAQADISGPANAKHIFLVTVMEVGVGEETSKFAQAGGQTLPDSV